jgi:hypothetical protein
VRSVAAIEKVSVNAPTRRYIEHRARASPMGTSDRATERTMRESVSGYLAALRGRLARASRF